MCCHGNSSPIMQECDLQSITDISELIVIIDIILQLANINGFALVNLPIFAEKISLNEYS